jgi:hypothetical protein
MARVYTFGKEPPEGVPVSPEYEELAARFKEAGGGPWRCPTGKSTREPGESAEASEEATTPADWVGERVRAFMEADEEVQGMLLGVTEHGAVIGVEGRRQIGPCFYAWKVVRWMYPVDRQEINERR